MKNGYCYETIELVSNLVFVRFCFHQNYHQLRVVNVGQLTIIGQYSIFCVNHVMKFERNRAVCVSLKEDKWKIY